MAEKLIAWALEHGATLHPGVEIYDDVTTGLSFRVKPGSSDVLVPTAVDSIVTIPAKLSLSYLDALATIPSDVLSAMKPHVIGRYFLIQQYLLRKDSFWWPYIQALPQPDDRDAWELPPFWPAELFCRMPYRMQIQS